jgi:septum formation protein
VLASRSPRRRELLAAAGFEFKAVAPRVREKSDVDLTVRELTAWNALRKGTAAARRFPDAVVLAADTLVAFEDDIIGKPADMNEARAILRKLSGQVHEVCSGVFIGDARAARSTMFVEISRVRFRALNERAIDDYFSKINPLDKAGAYAAQGHGADIIAEVHGSFSNVVGLPMEATIAALRDFGIRPARR